MLIQNKICNRVHFAHNGVEVGEFYLNKDGFIHSLEIYQKFRNNGLGGKLMQEILDLAKERKLTKIFLDVDIRNIPAVKIYQRSGFKFTGIKNSYPAVNCEYYWMVCQLPI